MTKDLTLDKKIIGAIGAFLFISPNLNIIESILMYCGLNNHDTVRMIAIGLFALFDLVLGIMFIKVKPCKRFYLILIVFNVLYILPQVINKDFTSVLQYIMFILPVTIFAISLAGDDDIKDSFFRYLRVATKILFVLAIIYIILQYVGTEKDDKGVIVIYNMSYGDMGYLFLTGFTVSAIEYKEKRKVFALIEIVVFSLAVFFSGTRSAILCVAFTVLLWIVLIIIGEGIGRKEKKSVLISAIVIIITIIIGLIIVPSGSRLSFLDGYISWSDFSIKSLFFEARAEANYDEVVIYVPTNTERKISEIFEEEIVSRDTTKAETEDAIHEDVKANKNKLIKLRREEDRAFVENYRPNTHRTFLWRTAIKEFKKSPILGNGPCYYKNKYDGYYPHNIVLEIMADFGTVGLVVLVSLGLYCFIRGVRYYKKDNSYFGFGLILLLFSHIPRYLLYTTIYSNPTIAMTIVLFVTIGKLDSGTLNKQSK